MPTTERRRMQKRAYNAAARKARKQLTGVRVTNEMYDEIEAMAHRNGDSITERICTYIQWGLDTDASTTD